MSGAVQAEHPADGAFAEEQGMPGLKIDARRIWSAIYRHRFVAGIIIALALLAAVVASVATTPVYSARATLQVDSEASDVLEDDTSVGTIDWDVERFLQTQIDVLLSRNTALTLIDRMNLAADENFFERMQVAPPQVAAQGKTIGETRRDVVASILQGNVDAELPRYSRIVDLTFESPDPEYAAEIANGYAEAFIAATLERRFDSSSYAREYLAEQLAEAKSALEAAEQAQLNYARANDLVNIDNGDNDDRAPVSLTQRTLVNANDSLGSARAQRIAAEQRYRSAARGDPLEIPEVQSSPYIAQLQREIAEVEAAMNRDSARYRDGHPVMIGYGERLASLRSNLNAAVADVRGSLRQQYQAAVRNEQQLSRDVDSLRGGTAREQSRRVEFNILSRETNTRRDMYDALLARLQEVSASAGVSNSNISIIDRAGPPQAPVRPRPLVYIALGLLAGLLAAGLYIAMREFLDDAARTPEDIADRYGLPYLGSLPRLDGGRDALAEMSKPKSDVSEAFAALRTSLGLVGGGGAKDILITSAQQSEGKSFAALGLAQSYAREGRSVLIVDADLRRPSQHRIFGQSQEKGLTTVLSGQIAASEALVPVMDNISLVTSGPLPPSVPEFFSGAAFDDFHAWAEQAFDIVLYDGPPVLALAEPILLAQKIATLVFVIEADRPSHGKLAAAIRRLRDNGARIDAAVLNKFDPRATGYGYRCGNYYDYEPETA